MIDGDAMIMWRLRLMTEYGQKAAQIEYTVITRNKYYATRKQRKVDIARNGVVIIEFINYRISPIRWKRR